MRKLILILGIILIGFVSFAQDKTLRGSLQGPTIDSLRTTIAALTQEILVLGGHDFTAPGIDSAYIQSDARSVIVGIFDEPLGRSDNDSIDAAFSFTYGTETGVVDSAVVSGINVFVYASTDIPADSVVYLSYELPVSGGVHDETGNDLISFSNKLVFNGTSVAEYIATAFWRLNNSYEDTYNSANDGTAVNSPTFTGDTALIFTGADDDRAVSIPSSIITGDHTFWFWLLLDEDANEDYYFFANRLGDNDDGFYAYADGGGAGTFNLNYRVGNGVSGTFAFDNSGSFTVDTWHHVVYRVNRTGNSTDAYCRIYVDGVLANTNDSILENFSDDFIVTPAAVIGARNPGGELGGLRQGAILGEFGIDNTLWTQDQIDSSYAQGGNTLWQVETTPTPDAYDTTYVLYETVDFTGVTPGPLTTTILEALYIGDVFSSSSLGNVVEFDGDTVWQVTHPTVASQSGAQYIMETPTNYDEGWYSYNIWLGNDWPTDFSVGGKAPGMMVLNRDNTGAPTAGVSGPTCTGHPYPNYLITDGATIRGGIIDHYTGNDMGWYLYDHSLDFRPCTDLRATYGADLFGGFADEWGFGTWHGIMMRVVLNTVTVEGTGDANGILEFYKDGVCGAIYTDRVFRNYSDMHIDTYFNSLFFGGPEDPTRTSVATTYIDDLTWFDFADGHPYAVGQASNPVGTVVPQPNMK